MTELQVLTLLRRLLAETLAEVVRHVDGWLVGWLVVWLWKVEVFDCKLEIGGWKIPRAAQ